MKRFILLLPLLCGCLGPVGGSSPSPNKDVRSIGIAVIEDSYKRTKDCPQADSKYWAELRKRPGVTAAELIDKGNNRADRFKVQAEREGVPALVIYDMPKGATRGQVRYSGKLPATTDEISSIVTKAGN